MEPAGLAAGDLGEPGDLGGGEAEGAELRGDGHEGALDAGAEDARVGGHGGGDLDFSELWMDLNPGGFMSFLEEDVFQGMIAPDLLHQPLGAPTPRMDLVGEMCASCLA